MKHKDFGYYELHFVHKWFRVTRECIETHMFEYSDDNEEGGEVLHSNTMIVRLLFMKLPERI